MLTVCQKARPLFITGQLQNIQKEQLYKHENVYTFKDILMGQFAFSYLADNDDDAYLTP